MGIKEIIISLLIIGIISLLFWLTSKPGLAPLISPEDEKAFQDCYPEEDRNGNAIITYTDFPSFTESLFKDISGASRHIHFQFFKFEDDEIGNRIADSLARKAAEGVEVRVLYDDAANLSRKAFYKRLAARGVAVCAFGKMRLPLIRKSDNYRNHRKVVVIDGKAGYLGGMNIADRYGKGLEWGIWRDTQIRVEGPAVAQLQRAFLYDWRYASSERLACPAYFPPLPEAGHAHIDVLTSGPIGDGPVIMERICRILDESRHYVYLESPYLIPSKALMTSLCAAARRGTDVRIIIPPRGDRGLLTPLASKSYIAEALDAGIKIAFYQKGYMHAKTLVCDDRISSVGSSNIDVRSYELDLEINAFVLDRPFALEMKDIFRQDEANADYIDPALWPTRSVAEKIGERFARLFSAQL